MFFYVLIKVNYIKLTKSLNIYFANIRITLSPVVLRLGQVTAIIVQHLARRNTNLNLKKRSEKIRSQKNCLHEVILYLSL